MRKGIASLLSSREDGGREGGNREHGRISVRESRQHSKNVACAKFEEKNSDAKLYRKEKTTINWVKRFLRRK